MPDVRTHDVVVIGAGAVGENVADRAGRRGADVAVVEAELVGGQCSYWACMPSKALLRPGAALAAARGVAGSRQAVTGPLHRDAVLERRDTFTHGWDDSSQVSWLDRAGVTLYRGHARLAGQRRVEVSDQDDLVLCARHAVVVATGSEAWVPDVPGLRALSPWTNRAATETQAVPDSLAVIGGGPVAVEMATVFADLGSSVTLLARGERLLADMEPFVGEAVATGLEALGIDVRLRTEATAAHRAGSEVELTLSDGRQLVAAEILVGTGRRPRTSKLGLETVGLEPGAPLHVDESGMVRDVDGDWLWAVGDVTGRTGTTHQGKYDARICGDTIAHRIASGTDEPDDAWGRFRATADHRAVPQVVFSRPEVASVGLTEAEARETGASVRAVSVLFSTVAGASLLLDQYEGTASIVVDTEREVLLGATFVGPEVAELLHAATIAVVGETPIDRLWHAVPAYPTLSEVWLRLLEAYGC